MTESPDPAAATLDRLGRAFADRDVDGFRALLAEDAVIHPPFLTRAHFEFAGRDQATLAVWALFHHLDGFVVTGQLAGPAALSLSFDARLDGHPVRGALLSRLDEHGMISRGDLLFQDAVALCRFGEATAPRLLGTQSRVLAAAARPPTRVLTAVMRGVDRLVGHLLTRTVARSAPRVSTLPRPR